jgi:hypothetical protein
MAKSRLFSPIEEVLFLKNYNIITYAVVAPIARRATAADLKYTIFAAQM